MTASTTSPTPAAPKAPPSGIPLSSFLYAAVPNPVPLDGCIRNLIVNDRLYDLANPGRSQGSTLGCKQTEDKCASNDLSGPGYCVHGECVASFTNQKCDCDPGWTGLRCDQRIQWAQFERGSFINYAFTSATTLPSRETDIKLLFLAESDNGNLARGQNLRGSEYVSPQIENREVLVESQLGSGTKELRLTGVRLSRNQSYWLHVQRVNEWSQLSLDGLPGRFSVESRGERIGQELNLDYDKGAFFLGADRENPGPLQDFKGCVGDFRWDDYYLPLNTSFTADSVPYATVKTTTGVQPGCSLMASCASSPGLCAPPFICFDFWKGPFCTCPEGQTPVMREGTGTLIGCGETQAYLRLGLSNSAVAAILVCLLALIVLVLFLVVYSKRRRPGPRPFLAGDDIRENIINYHEEGGGEEDQDTYNIKPLRKPVLPTNGLGYGATGVPPLRNGAPSPGEVGDFIAARKREADGDPSAPPFDELRLYADEGEGLSPAGSLSSLESLSGSLPGEGEMDMEDLRRWGPRFGNLASLYSQ